MILKTHNGRWKIDVGLDKGDDFGTGFGSCYHEHVFGITQNSVVEEDTKEHQR